MTRLVHDRAGDVGPLRASLERFPFQAAAKFCLGRLGVPVREDVRRPLRTLLPEERKELARVARIVIAGAGAIGASIAYQLALRGADDVVLADRAEIASGSTGKAMGGVRQQFSTEAEVRLARESIGFFQELGRRSSTRSATSSSRRPKRGGDARAQGGAAAGLGVPVERVDPSRIAGLRTDDVLGAVACWEDGVAEPAAVARELVRRAAERGVEVREGTDARELERDVLVIAAGAFSPELWPACRSARSVASSSTSARSRASRTICR